MDPIKYIDRINHREEIEKVYGGNALKFLYGHDWVSSLLGAPLLHLCVKLPWFSAFYGYCQQLHCSKKKIRPFIQNFDVNADEFLEDVESYKSFNDFFIRKLKPEARPIAAVDNIAIIPADGRYRFYQDISKSDGFLVKGQKFSLEALLKSASLAEKYAKGAMVMARLCPSDYHRYHFPCACMPGESRLINGWLQSVNPIATHQNIHIFSENKRTICELQSDAFGKVIFMEIGATNVGSINQTYIPNQFCPKGAEKGYFSFGASSLILLFEPNRIVFDSDLLELSKQTYEIKCLMGQPMGYSQR